MAREDDDAPARVSRWSRTSGKAARPNRPVPFPGVSGERVRLWAPTEDEEQESEVATRQRLTGHFKLTALDLSLASETALVKSEYERQVLFRVMRDPENPALSYFESVDELREALQAPQREALMKELRLWKAERYPELKLEDLPEGSRAGRGLLDWMTEAKTGGALGTWWGSFDPDTQFAIVLALVDAQATATPPSSSPT